MKKISKIKNSKIKNRICSSVAATVGVVSFTLANTMPVYATSASGISLLDNGMKLITGAGIAICEAIGILGIIKGGMDFSTGVSQRDQSGIVQGGAELFGGLFMAGIGIVIGLFGL